MAGAALADKFQLFRISLLQRAQIDAFENPRLTREEFLREVFSENWEFPHYGSRFHYRPDPSHSAREVLMGRLGRRVLTEENSPPEMGLEEVIHEAWKACLIVVDPTDHVDGQKASVEVFKEIGGPIALISALARCVNQQRPHAPFVMDVQPIFDAATFWEFARQNQGQVTSITFDFVTPNGLWSVDEEMRDELIELRKAIKTQSVSTTFKSSEGLDTDAKQIKDAVDYAETGSGKIRARARRDKTFNSTEKPKIVTLSEDRQARESLLDRAAAKWKKILGRE
ncbi:hypothetical protein SAMN02799626_01435 [Caulobacter sp. UNC279MFTsu5.1]|nr:hypothetical protein SAMN02799626_01435 [Caulobacter sp. UNC279MFTsu5.1]